MRRDEAKAAQDVQVADSAGVVGAIFAALCCAGTPIIASGLAAAGLSFLRRDAILWPIMLASLGIALWGFWRGLQHHHHRRPIALGILGALSLALGIITVHGPPAIQMIYGGAIALLFATAWNVWARYAVDHVVMDDLHGSRSK